jgi:aspartate aminotransferase
LILSTRVQAIKPSPTLAVTARAAKLKAEGKDIIGLGAGEPDFDTPQHIKDAAIAAINQGFTQYTAVGGTPSLKQAVYTLDDLKALGAVLRKHPNILISTDDMYEHIALTDEKFVNILNACPDLYSRTMVLNGVSKSYAMTGWRIGYAGGPEHIITAMENVQSQSTSNPTSISQVAAEAALNGDQGCIVPMLKAFRERHVFVVDTLNRIPGVKCIMAGGAFYAFPDVHEVIFKLHQRGTIKAATDVALSEYLLENGGVAVVPGSAFGSEGYIRLSFATSMNNLTHALERIAKAFA